MTSQRKNTKPKETNLEEYKKATGISDRHPREKMDFGEEFAENKNIPHSQPKEINPVSVKSKNEPKIN